MQPFAMNFTLMNRESLHSKLMESPIYTISLLGDDYAGEGDTETQN